MSNTEPNPFKEQKHITIADLAALQDIHRCYRDIVSDIQRICISDLITPGEHTRSFALEANNILEQTNKLNDIIYHIIHDYGNSAM